MFCPQCGNSNNNSAKFCSGCGNALPQAVQNVPPPHTENTSRSLDEVYKAVVGPKNQDYYLRHFSRFDRNNKVGATWHWPAFFASFYWFLYRKMWLNALIYFFLPYLVVILFAVIAAVTGGPINTTVSVGYVLYFACVFLLLPMYANAFYYKHCKKKILRANTSSQDFQRQLGELSAKGGTSSIAAIIIFIFAFIFLIGILAAISVPAYQDYTIRSRVSEAVSLSSNTRIAIETAYSEGYEIGHAGNLPIDPKSLGLEPSWRYSGKYVKAVTYNAQGVVTVILQDIPELGSASGKTVIYVPVFSGKEYYWQVSENSSVPKKYLPRY